MPPVFIFCSAKKNKYVRKAHEKRHAKGVPFRVPAGRRAPKGRYPLPYSNKVGTGRAGAPQSAASNSP